MADPLVDSSSDDRYILRWVGLHLVEAGLAPELHALLARGGADNNTNAWYEALRRRGLRNQFLIDVARASAAAESDDADRRRSLLAIRYGLYEASLRTSAARVRPSVLAGMLRHGLIDFADAHADVLLEPETESLSRKLGLLAKMCPEMADVILTSVGSIKDPRVRCEAVVEVVPFLSTAAGPTALALARDHRDPGLRAWALAAVAAASSDVASVKEIGREVVGALRDSDDPELEVATYSILQALASGAPLQALARNHVSAAWRIGNSLTRARALGDAIVSLLRAGLVEDALAALQRKSTMAWNLVEDRVLPELPIGHIHHLCASVTSEENPGPRDLEQLALVAPRLEPEDQRIVIAWALDRFEALDQNTRPSSSLRPFVKNAPDSELTRMLTLLRDTDDPACADLCTRLCQAQRYDEALRLASATQSKLWAVYGRVALVKGGHPQRATLLAEALDDLADIEDQWLPTATDELLPLLDADQTARAAHLLANRSGGDRDLNLLVRCALTPDRHQDAEAAAEEVWTHSLHTAEEYGEVSFACWLALALSTDAGALGSKPDIATVLSTLRGSSDAVFWRIPGNLHPLVAADEADDVLATVTALEDNQAVVAGGEAVVPALAVSELGRLLEWTVQAKNEGLLAIVAERLASDDLELLHELVHQVADVPLLIAAISIVEPSNSARSIIERRLGELMLGNVGAWSSLRSGHAAGIAGLVVEWARDDADQLLDIVAELHDAEVESVLTAAVVVGAPGHTRSMDRLNSVVSELPPIAAMIALGPAAGTGIESGALLDAAARLLPAVQSALADRPHVPTDLSESLAHLAAVASGPVQEQYSQLAIVAADLTTVRESRALAVGRLSELLPSRNLPRVLEAVNRLEEDGVFGPRSRASAVNSLATRFATEGMTEDSLALVDSVHDPSHRFVVLYHLGSALPSGAGVDLGWLTRPGRRTRAECVAELAGASAAQCLDLPAEDILRITDDCLRWWP